MTSTPTRLVLLCACSALFSWWVPPAAAELVRTEELAAAGAAVEARERIVELAQRPELARELADRGVAPEQARARVDAMTDAEVIALVEQLDTLPAAGRMSTDEFIIILLLIIILALAL